MQHQMHPLIQLVPDWMVGTTGKIVAFATAGSGPLLAVVDGLPPGVSPVLAATITVLGGIVIALINKSATRARDAIERQELRAENLALKTQNKILAAVPISVGTATTASGNHLIPVTPPNATPVGGTPVVKVKGD